jgi:hypothetical protein
LYSNTLQLEIEIEAGQVNHLRKPATSPSSCHPKWDAQRNQTSRVSGNLEDTTTLSCSHQTARIFNLAFPVLKAQKHTNKKPILHRDIE